MGVHSFYITIQTPVMCDVFSWNIMCDISYGILCAVFSEGLP